MKKIYLDRIVKMMNYLGLIKYNVPHYKIPASDLPYSGDGRYNKEYTLLKNGTLTYKARGGTGSNYNISDIERRELDPSEEFLREAARVLAELCKDKAMRVAQSSDILNLHKLILVFRGLDFIQVSEHDLNKFEYGGYGF
jgi:hypothetical protein